MKPILHIITTISRGGAENQLLILAGEQVASGDKVSMIYLKDNPDLKEDFTNLGVEVISQFANLNPLRQSVLIRKYLSNRNVIIHAHLPRAELIARFSIAQQIFVVSRHNAEPFFPGAPKFLSILLSRLVTRRANLCIAISKAVLNYLQKNSEISPKAVSAVVLYGYQKQRILHSRILSDGTKNYRIGTIARLVPQKDYPTLLRAFALILDDIPQATLSIVGSGPLEKDLKELADKLGIRNKIDWQGRRGDIDNYLQNIDLFLLTSIYEGFGLVLLEAMANRVPVIAAKNSAIPEVIGDFSETLFETGNHLDLSKKILASFSLQSRMAIVQRQILRLEKFDARDMSNEIKTLYKLLEEII
jgi:glycosyltransferase involved in cell wall biosynthesis